MFNFIVNAEMCLLTDLFFFNFQTSRCERRINQLQQLNEQPLYPTEKVIWDENLVPYDQYNGEGKFTFNSLSAEESKSRIFQFVPNLY